ncbi:unnamed protein product [Acanthoscelides obtectus]|uniref:Uncharacterized protein n=1 Tax=Acanthoscelides obtectus TaxID=200917 RepID=A0A9P0M4G0_ACAOB|nr:unnamed protein product [Acanthoscelides obtectus]CAK1675939.1 hypothetical protein AOBTE_LOCUS30500 [Acanthoscelides obtectus]
MDDVSESCLFLDEVASTLSLFFGPTSFSPTSSSLSFFLTTLEFLLMSNILCVRAWKSELLELDCFRALWGLVPESYGKESCCSVSVSSSTFWSSSDVEDFPRALLMSFEKKSAIENALISLSIGTLKYSTRREEDHQDQEEVPAPTPAEQLSLFINRFDANISVFFSYLVFGQVSIGSCKSKKYPVMDKLANRIHKGFVCTCIAVTLYGMSAIGLTVFTKPRIRLPEIQAGFQPEEKELMDSAPILTT